MGKQHGFSIRAILLAVIVTGAPVFRLSAQQGSHGNPASATAASPGAPIHYRPARFPKRAEEYYGLVWGIDLLSVKAAESGALIRFSYRVLDRDKARPLNDKNIEAFLNAPERRIQLVIPSLEKVGKLRQTGDPESGKVYWMAFSNPHRIVKRGDRVDVVIGDFHANGLAVE